MKSLFVLLTAVAVTGIAVASYPGVRATLLGPLGDVLPGDHSAAHEAGGEPRSSDKDAQHAPHRAAGEHAGQGHHARHKIVTTNPVVRDVTLTQPFVCQIHSRRHIDVKALEGGYLQSIHFNEGQFVRKGEVLFHILPTLYSARVEADMAEAKLAQVEYENTKQLVSQNIVSPQELKLAQAKLDKALAQVKLAQAEMNFADIRAPFDGIVDRLHEQEGSLIEEGAMLTTMSDNSVMWVYFNVPEKYYLAYQKATAGSDRQQLDIRLRLANQELFDQAGEIAAIEADFDNETGNISFRADFPNPDGLLRHGQTGTVLINHTEKDALVIPQRSAFEILAKKYVYVVDSNHIVRQREIEVVHEMEDLFVIRAGLEASDQIVLEGVLQVRDGDEVECEFVQVEEVMSHLKYHAE